MNTQKIAFLGLVLIGSLIGFVSTLRMSRPEFAQVRPLVIATAVFSVTLILNMVLALRHGATAMEWLRDSISYILVALAPMLYLWLRPVKRSHLHRVVVATGLIAAFFFAYRWISSRGLAGANDQTSLGLASFLLAGLALCWGLDQAINRGKIRAAGAYGGFIMAMLLVSGTRTAVLVLILPFLVFLLGSRRYGVKRLVRSATVVLMMVAISLSATYLIVASVGIDQQRLQDRYLSIASPSSLAKTDVSYQMRREATAIAQTQLARHPVGGLGAGVGFTVGNQLAYASSDSATGLDTPFEFPAKFGILGCAGLAGYVLCLISFFRRSEHSRATEITGFAGAMGALLILTALIVNPFSDKGFGLALLFSFLILTSPATAPQPGVVSQLQGAE
jgi:hypothetical protein